MVKRMLVDTNHPEETRVVVIDGTRLEGFDLETSTKQENKGNIYLAKVVRVEPSLQAAFVDYGGNRHGFLAFSEIHPDYYQIPVADREALIEEAKEHHDSMQAEDEPPGQAGPPDEPQPAKSNPENPPEEHKDNPEQIVALVSSQPPLSVKAEDSDFEMEGSSKSSDAPDSIETRSVSQGSTAKTSLAENSTEDTNSDDAGEPAPKGRTGVEEIGGEDETDENLNAHRRKFVASRRYKIQEVIKRKQILLIQVVKEERGNKGAALTTYLSLAGRYCVLMPNSARGGGVSRKITNVKDRRRLKSIVSDLKISEHMAVILRTAGAERSKAEIKRDYEYLQRTWNQIRQVTMASRAPALIHEEANLIKRSIRDVYTKDIEEILVEGENGYKAAKEFMRTLTPSHAKKVQRYKDESIPLFHRYQIESQLDAMNSPTTQLKSGGSIVFGQTEALVAIDVNSGKSTKERHIEGTALKTNLEAADEIARQLRLRDLAGLVVIDFIDMDEARNNHAVERRLKEALKSDRARIQVGRISHFGLLELSRQRLRPSLLEANFAVCTACTGTGIVRSIESTSMQTLRAIEEEGLRHRTAELTVSVHTEVALYILNYKRAGLEDIQKRYDMNVFILGDSELIPPDIRMERVKVDGQKKVENPRTVEQDRGEETAELEDEPDGPNEEGEKKRRRRKRRRKRSEGEDVSIKIESGSEGNENASSQIYGNTDSQNLDGTDQKDQEDGEEPQRKGRRRGRRGGRRRRKHSDDQAAKIDNQQDSNNTEEGDGPISSASDTSNATRSDESSSADAPDPSPMSKSGFFNVFKKGAEAIRSSVKEGGGSKESAPASMERPSSEPKETPRLQSTTTKPLSSTVDTPTGSPRKGWWNNDT
ncbi:MAG: Rne/Rng family ribonuclease [Rhodospirillaceae bacterium]|nr:Rne/Rng family ribonuclease [Rhodospirillaceae bacterium]